MKITFFEFRLGDTCAVCKGELYMTCLRTSLTDFLENHIIATGGELPVIKGIVLRGSYKFKFAIVRNKITREWIPICPSCQSKADKQGIAYSTLFSHNLSIR